MTVSTLNSINFTLAFFIEYCDGIKAQCPGLKQWGTVDLAKQGYTPIEILRYYYGRDIELVESNNIGDVEQSYPGYLSQGSRGNGVLALQNYLNRIRANYPNIPQITKVDGIYGAQTIAAVKAFKTSARWLNASSAPSGDVDKATWYNISYAYYAVKKLAQLASEGEVIDVGRTPPANVTVSEGSRGTYVGTLQYLLNVISDFYPEVRPVIQDYSFKADTDASVKDFQKAFKLTPDGADVIIGLYPISQ
jgi:peptidoglycan hydrolase-like protein with peptidoglycan-binding domain